MKIISLQILLLVIDANHKVPTANIWNVGSKGS